VDLYIMGSLSER